MLEELPHSAHTPACTTSTPSAGTLMSSPISSRSLVLGITVAMASLACQPGKYETGQIRHLFGYDRPEITAALGSLLSEPLALQSVRRNGAGTAAYFLEPAQSGARIVILSSGNSPRVIETPGSVAFLDDAANVVAWSQDLNAGVYLGGGRVLHLRAHGAFGADPSGTYYFAEISDSGSVLGAFEAPDKPLGTSKHRGTKVFWKSPRLYFFGYDPATAERELVCEVWERRETSFNLIDEIKIARGRTGAAPFEVVDLDPWSDHVLLRDGCDVPCASTWLLYSLKERSMRRLGVGRDFGLFLLGDLLRGDAGHQRR